MTKIPSAQWAQREEVTYVTFRVCDCKNAAVEFQGQKVNFTGEANKQSYAVSVDLFDEIDPEKSTWVKEGRGVFCTLSKKTKCYWPRLLKENKKQHWLSVDFQRWKDEDDSSDEEGQAGNEPDFMKMMNQMGGGDGGMPSMEGIGEDSDDAVDSDDEDIPTLENNAGDADE